MRTPGFRDNFRIRLSRGDVEVIQSDNLGVVTRGTSIVITPGQRGQEELDTWVHETLHVALPKLSETEVSRVASDVAKILWAAGWRRPKPRKAKEDE